MTLFNTTSTDPGIEQIDPNKDYLAELVGEGKKFKDPVALARAKKEADNFITQLTRENAEMRKENETLTTEVRSRQTVEEILKSNLKPQTQQTQNNQNTVEPENQEQVQTLTPQDIEEMLNRREQAKSAQSNADLVRERLEKEWGPNYEVHLREQAKALGVGTKFLDDLATSQPQAFFKLVGLDEKPATSTGLPQRTVSTEALGAQRGQKIEKGASYYNKMRKEQGSAKFFSIPIQQEILKRIQEIGEEAFHNN